MNTPAKIQFDLVMQCAFAVLAGQQTVTISATGKLPAGFPRGELLSVGTDGTHNYACHPVKVLAWLHARTSKPPNAELTDGLLQNIPTNVMINK